MAVKIYIRSDLQGNVIDGLAREVADILGVEPKKLIYECDSQKGIPSWHWFSYKNNLPKGKAEKLREMEYLGNGDDYHPVVSVKKVVEFEI